MGKIVRFFKSKRGQSLVEMALVLPILLLLVAGAIDLGRAFNAKISINNAAREGARYASRFPDENADIISVVEDELAGSAVPPDEVEIDIDGLGGDGGQPIRVTVTYELPTILGSLMEDIIQDATIRIESANEMVIID